MTAGETVTNFTPHHPMSKAKEHRSPEQTAYLKARFDWLRKRTKGQSRHPALGSPFSGKNRAQRTRIKAAFSNFRTF